jgi:hypothetical protein
MNPLCKVCGKPVPKVTRSVSFGCRTERRYSTGHLQLTEKPANLAEAQRFINGRIISHKWSWRDEDPRWIESVNVWDGESYVWGGHFHAQGCAAEFGEAMAALHPRMAMPAYHAAIKDRGVAVKEPA